MRKISLYALVAFSASMFLIACNSSDNNQMADNMDQKMDSTSEEMTMNIDLDRSKIMWKGTMVGVYSHSGNLRFKEGTLTMQNGKVTGGNFVVDMSSINPTDSNYNVEEGKTPEKLKGHLSSNDFFAVDSFSNASFTINGTEDGEVMGMLTVRGITKEESVDDINIIDSAGMMKITGDMTFNRKDFNVMFESTMQEMVLSNDVELDIELVAKQ